jgi:hypothetical protein
MVLDKASSSVSSSNVDALFLSLAVTGILEILNRTDRIMWIVGREVPVVQQQLPCVTLVEATIGIGKYIKDNYWVGINQHPPTRIRLCTPSNPVARYLSLEKLLLNSRKYTAHSYCTATSNSDGIIAVIVASFIAITLSIILCVVCCICHDCSSATIQTFFMFIMSSFYHPLFTKSIRQGFTASNCLPSPSTSIASISPFSFPM